MAKSSMKNESYAKNFLYLFIFMMLIWLALTSSLHWQELIVGCIVSIIISIFLNSNYQNLGLPALSLTKILYIFLYLIVLFIEVVKANFDVAYRVLHPKMPIKPGVVIIKTSLRQNIAKLILANSITLTPGTFTLDIEKDKLLIHWIYVRSENIEDSTKLIGARFEKYLGKIFS